MAAPAPRGAFGVSEAERVVKQTEKRDADQIDDPASQFRFEQVEAGPLVQNRQGSQRDEGSGNQYRAERKGKLLAPVVDPGQASPEEPADAGGDDQQADEDGDGETEPGYGSALP